MHYYPAAKNKSPTIAARHYSSLMPSGHLGKQGEREMPLPTRIASNADWNPDGQSAFPAVHGLTRPHIPLFPSYQCLGAGDLTRQTTRQAKMQHTSATRTKPANQELRAVKTHSSSSSKPRKSKYTAARNLSGLSDRRDGKRSTMAVAFFLLDRQVEAFSVIAYSG